MWSPAIDRAQYDVASARQVEDRVLQGVIASIRGELDDVFKPLHECLVPRAQIRDSLRRGRFPRPLSRADRWSVTVNKDSYRINTTTGESVIVFPGSDLVQSPGTPNRISKAWISVDGGKNIVPAVSKTSVKNNISFQRERLYAAHLMGLANNGVTHRTIVQPLLISDDKIFYQCIADQTGTTRNLGEANEMVSVVEWLACMQKVATGLGWLDTQRLLALDLQPGNIFLGENNSAFLGDLGLRHHLDLIDVKHGLESNPVYYDHFLTVTAQRRPAARDVPVKYAFGNLLLEGLIRFNIIRDKHNRPKLPPSARLFDLVQSLLEADSHPYWYVGNKQGSQIDKKYYSWERIARELEVR